MSHNSQYDNPKSSRPAGAASPEHQTDQPASHEALLQVNHRSNQNKISVSTIQPPAELLIQLPVKVVRCDKIGRPEKQIWQLQAETGDYILKTSPSGQPYSPKKRLSDYYLSKEAAIYRQLLLLFEQMSSTEQAKGNTNTDDTQQAVAIQHLPSTVSKKNASSHLPQFAKFIDYQPGSWLLIEKIPNARRGWHRDQITRRQLLETLLTFQHLPLKPWARGLLPRLAEAKNSLTGKTLIWSLTRILPKLGPLASLKTIHLLRKALKAQPRLSESIWLHNDLLRRNNMLSTDQGLYLIDFESVRQENRWVLQDIVDVSLYQKQFKLNKKLLSAYLKKLIKRHPCYEAVNVPMQVRMVLLHRFMARILPDGKHSEDHRQQWFNFFQYVLLSDTAYKAWYKDEVDL